MSYMDEMSYVLFRDLVEIKSTLLAIDERKYQCDPCHQIEPQRQAKAQRLQGCTQVVEWDVCKLDDQMGLHTCPGNYYSETVVGLLAAFTTFELGVMPYPGSYFDQPAKVLEIFTIIRQHRFDKIEREQRDKTLNQALRNRGRRN